jgi:hypothetical protein
MMSDIDTDRPPPFPMPRTIPNGPVFNRGLAAVAEAVAEQHAATSSYATPPIPSNYKTPGHSAAIKDRLKQLTHREMRDFVAEIFAAHRKLRSEHQSASDVDDFSSSITLAQLPDVLDKFAYGD